MAVKKLTNARKKTIASGITLLLVLGIYLLLRGMILSGAMDSYISGILNMICINIVAAVSLNLVTGMLGQLVLGHAGFMLVGGYVASIVTAQLDISLYVALPLGLVLGGLLAAALGVCIGLPALRLRGDYLAIITLGFGEIIRVVATNLSITGGAKGISNMGRFGRGSAGMFTFVFFCAVLTIFFMYTLGTSRQGRAILSIREDEISAEASGVNTTYYKLLAFALSAFFAGIAGGLYAHHIGIIQPVKFDFNYSVEILMMVVLGGMGSITGAVIGAVSLTILPELLRYTPALVGAIRTTWLGGIIPEAVLEFLSELGTYRMLLYSIILVLMMLFRPKGLFGRKEIRVIAPFEKLVAWARGKRKGGAGA